MVVLRARDGVPMRAKVTLRLEEPQTQAAADELAERCADLVRLVVREAPSATAVLGLESAIAVEVALRLSKQPIAIRGVELAGLHIVGDPGHVGRPASAKDESPAWLSAAPSGLDRLTPIHPVPSSRPTWTSGAPPSSVGPGEGRLMDRSLDRPTPIHPVPSSRPATSGAASLPHTPAAPTPHMGIPVVAKSHAHAPAHEPAAPTPHMGIPVVAKAHAHAHEPAGAASAHVVPHPTHAAEPVAHVSARPHDAFASTAVSAAPPLDAAGRVRMDHAAPAHGHPPSAAPHGRPGSVPPPTFSPVTNVAPHGRPGSVPPPTFSPVTPAPPHSVSPGSRPPSGTMQAVGLGARPPSGTMQAVDEHSSVSRRGSALPPSSVGPGSVGSSTRRSSRPPPGAVAARRRVVAARLPLPTGAGPYEVARGLTPLFRDTAARILVAFLRTYDLAVVRRVPFDAVEGDILSSLTAPSDGAPGTYAASHAAEIQRWRDAFGAATMEKLQREANLAATALAFQGFTGEGVSQRTTNAVVEGLAGSAFGDPDMIIDLGRYLFPANETTAAETLANMIDVAGEGMPPGLEGAMEPLFASLREDVAAAALIARDVMTSV